MADDSVITQQLNALTPHQWKIIRVLYFSRGIWQTRARLARALGKRRLTPYDIDCLHRLTASCLVDTTTREAAAPGSDFAYLYNLTPPVADWLNQNQGQRQTTLDDDS